MEIKALRTRVFREGDDLAEFIVRYIPRLRSGSIVVVTSKIVSLAERRTVPETTEKERDRLIQKESQWAIRTPQTWLTIKDNTVMASAGVDRSNADGKIILLPKDSFQAATALRRALMKKYGVKKLGVLISDSRLFPLRAGITGVALGYAGFKGVRDNRGNKDIFGRPLKMSRVDVADSLATAAVVVMGEADEQQPLAVITNAPVQFMHRINRHELIMDFRDDVYLPLFQKAKKVTLKKVKGPW